MDGIALPSCPQPQLDVHSRASPHSWPILGEPHLWKGVELRGTRLLDLEVGESVSNNEANLLLATSSRISCDRACATDMTCALFDHVGRTTRPQLGPSTSADDSLLLDGPRPPPKSTCSYVVHVAS